MTTYAEIVRRLGIEQVCLGGCGLSDYQHRGIIFLGVIHFRERRFTRRGLRRFLLLVAERSRLADPGFLNGPDQEWYALWWDEQRANFLAAQVGYRFPASWSVNERMRSRYLASKTNVKLARDFPAVYSWQDR